MHMQLHLDHDNSLRSTCRTICVEDRFGIVLVEVSQLPCDFPSFSYLCRPNQGQLGGGGCLLLVL